MGIEEKPFYISPEIADDVMGEEKRNVTSGYVEQVMQKAAHQHSKLYDYFQKNIVLFSPLSASYELGAAYAYDLSTKQTEEDNTIVEFDQKDIVRQTARSEAIFNTIDAKSIALIHKFLRGRRRKSTMQDFQLTLNILENRAPEALGNFRLIFKQATDADKKIMLLRGFVDGILPFYVNRLVTIENSEMIEKEIDRGNENKTINPEPDAPHYEV